ncbi:MAG TPA: SLATT domain-containing protein [Allosphingosinicella sp.]|nr:SLATT domain-containing protein [Allosphingosinicella sp.]
MAKSATKAGSGGRARKKTSKSATNNPAAKPVPDPVKWFKPFQVKGNFSPATLDGYFETTQDRLEDDMAFLRKPIERWRKRAYLVRFLAFLAVAAGVLLPLPIMNARPPFPNGLVMGYLAVVIGGLVLLFDRLYNISNSWVRLTLAEMQVKQVRYRLDLDWAKQRPALTADNGATLGLILIDLLRTALDAAHQIMETQKTAWTSELSQAMDALRSRLDADRATLDQMRAQRQQEEQRPTTGAVNLTIDKPERLKAPFVVRVAGEEKLRRDTVSARLSVNGIPAGLQTISFTANRATGSESFDYMVTEQVNAGEVKAIAVTVE